MPTLKATDGLASTPSPDFIKRIELTPANIIARCDGPWPCSHNIEPDRIDDQTKAAYHYLMSDDELNNILATIRSSRQTVSAGPKRTAKPKVDKPSLDDDMGGDED